MYGQFINIWAVVPCMGSLSMYLHLFNMEQPAHDVPLMLSGGKRTAAGLPHKGRVFGNSGAEHQPSAFPDGSDV
jgi:hypothetical protein